MAQWVRVLAMETDNLCSVPRAHSERSFDSHTRATGIEIKACLSEGVHKIFRGKSNTAEEMLLKKKIFSILDKSVNYNFVIEKMLIMVAVIIQLWIKICGNKYF